MIGRKRRYKKIDETALRRLWPSRLPDNEIARLMGHRASELRRHAEKLGLPTSRRKIWEHDHG